VLRAHCRTGPSDLPSSHDTQELPLAIVQFAEEARSNMQQRWSNLLLRDGGAVATAGGADAGGTPAAQGTDAQLQPAMCSALEPTVPVPAPAAIPAATAAAPATNPAAAPAASPAHFTSVYDQAASAIAATSRAEGGRLTARDGPAAARGGLVPEALGPALGPLVARAALALERDASVSLSPLDGLSTEESALSLQQSLCV